MDEKAAKGGGKYKVQSGLNLGGDYDTEMNHHKSSNPEDISTTPTESE